MSAGAAPQEGALGKSKTIVGRLVGYVAVVSVLAVVFSGCVAIKTESSTTRAPGVAKITLSVCASHRVAGSNCIPSPNATPGLVVNTAEGDNGSDALTSSDPTNPLKGQLLVGLPAPDGHRGAGPIHERDGRAASTKSQGYTNALTAIIPPSPGFRWVGYISSAVTLTGRAPLTILNVRVWPAGRR